MNKKNVETYITCRHMGSTEGTVRGQQAKYDPNHQSHIFFRDRYHNLFYGDKDSNKVRFIDLIIIIIIKKENRARDGLSLKIILETRTGKDFASLTYLIFKVLNFH